MGLLEGYLKEVLEKANYRLHPTAALIWLKIATKL